MNEWMTDAPTFAVVGKINMGKSSVLATLLEIDDDRVIRVSSTPGETTRCQALPLVFDDKEMIRFVDTPGFSRALEAMRAIQDLHGEGTPDLATVKKFVEQQLESGEFEDEARLLEPVIEGAGVLYVVDPSKPMRDAFVAEMEILRWTGRPRMALLNEKVENEERLEEWRARLGSYFNLVRTFNAHHARFEERRRLLRSLLEIDESHRGRIEETIRLIDQEWEQRREESAEVVITFLGKALGHRESVQLDEKEDELDHRKERRRAELTSTYYKSIARLEEKTYRKFLELYRHKVIKVEVDEKLFNGVDLSAAEIWKKWGLSRLQLTLTGGVAGGVAGAAVDLGTGGLTHGFGTVVFALGSAGAAFFRGNSLPDLKMDASGVSLGGQTQKALVVGPPANDNFPWILLDRVFHHYREIASRSHGRRDQEIREREEADAGWVRHFSRERRNKLQRWFSGQAKGGGSYFDPGVFQELIESLREVEQA
ncbi:GTPase/DUF3482 domain-containing protein [Akkermansiaceae bacterium]|nr:GTPase/DUF3482 domain-containing protein [Akkermansiaceae bacterium]MDB4544678.1 GTPase/DUF3482 domain-containing protein [Akkermansiaceae bacterium]